MVAAATPHSNTSGLVGRKADFPLLAGRAGGRALHYLDSAATTQKPAAVIDAMTRCLRTAYGPIHRGLYPLAESATAIYEAARAKIARFVGARDPAELVFTRSATEAINMVAWGWLRPRLRSEDRVWVTRMEHHSNFLPWQRLCRETGAELCIVELRPDGSLDLERAEGLFDRRTRFIALSQVSNVLGVENPVREICENAAAANIPVLVDATQSVPHMPVEVTALGCDFLAFSAHKMYGPTGIGALFGKAERLEGMEPLLLGGGMVDWVEYDCSGWAPVPERFEAGSPNLVGAVGFAVAVDYLSTLGIERVHAYVGDLARQAVDALAQIPQLRLIPGPASTRSSIVSFEVEGLHPHDVAQVSGDLGVALRAGHHCCQPLMQHLGVAATVRASFGIYNDLQDIEALVTAIEKGLHLFRKL